MIKLPKPVITREQLRSLPYDTPFFVYSPHAAAMTYKDFIAGMPEGNEAYFSMKSNAEPTLITTLHQYGCGFEVSSSYELGLLESLGVKPEKIIIGNPVKSVVEIKRMAAYGVDRYAFDSEEELKKLAVYAPGARVFLRTLVDADAKNLFTMSEKFGVAASSAPRLLERARKLGLKLYGLSFNVGSQARNPSAWANGVRMIVPLLAELQQQGIVFEMLNVGGGFPWQYDDKDAIANINKITAHIHDAYRDLPYKLKVFAEPGRGLSAHPYALVTSVIAKIKRHNGHWLYLDAGVYNPLLESTSFQGNIRYFMQPIKDYRTAPTDFIIAGPTCDDIDVLYRKFPLPADIAEGDRLVLYDVGAYSLTLSTSFNGFPKPRVHCV